MSDLNGFIRDVNLMFNDLDEQIEEICLAWIEEVTDYLVGDTPGPGNQFYHTRYIATGRLRQGYQFGLNPPASVPFYGHTGAEDQDDRATATRARLKAQLHVLGLQPTIYIWNEVGYGVWVHEGLESHAHIGQRKFTINAEVRAPALLESARLRVKGGVFGY